MHPILYTIHGVPWLGDLPIRSFGVMVMLGVIAGTWWLSGALRRIGVLQRDAASNLVTLGRREDLYRSEFDLEKVSFVATDPPADEFRTDVRIRHRADPTPGTVTRTPDGWSVTLDNPAWAPAPGQAAVFYAGDEVVGGGRIA